MYDRNEDQQPTAVLKSEHRTILRVIAVLERLIQNLERGADFEHTALSRCVEFFQLFADACHHAKEEELLFPVLEARGIPRDGGPIGVMLYEHGLARQYTRAMADALDARASDDGEAEERFQAAARAYIELLRHHIHKEDNVLFNMGDRVMSDDDQVTLCKQFCDVGCRAFGGKNRAALERMADELEQQRSTESNGD